MYTGAKCTPSLSGKCSMKPPNEASVDAIINTYAHEMWEALSDTYGVWYRTCDGYENADICNSNYGVISSYGDSITGNKINYNLQLGGNNYLVQLNWLRRNAYYSGNEKCAISADGTYLNNNDLSAAALYTIYATLIVIPICLICFFYFMCCHGNAHGNQKNDKSTQEIKEEISDTSGELQPKLKDPPEHRQSNTKTIDKTSNDENPEKVSTESPTKILTTETIAEAKIQSQLQSGVYAEELKLSNSAIKLKPIVAATSRNIVSTADLKSDTKQLNFDPKASGAKSGAKQQSKSEFKNSMSKVNPI